MNPSLWLVHDLAMMAERAHRFELDDDSASFIAQDNWQFDKAGLLAGERLSLQLQRLEHAHLRDRGSVEREAVLPAGL